MANDSSTPIDTSKTAGNFNDFLASQGLGEIDPGLASIYKQGIKNSPMDDILAANNMDLDQLFTIKKPKPPLDLGENLGSRENTDEVGVASPKSVQAAIDTLGLSVSEKETLSSLLNSGNTLDTGPLPLAVAQYTKAAGPGGATTMLAQIGELYSLAKSQSLEIRDSIIDLMLTLVNQSGLDSPNSLLELLRKNPAYLGDAIPQAQGEQKKTLLRTTHLRSASNAFSTDPIIGGQESETLYANRGGGATLIGGGGPDIYVVPLSSSPLPPASTLKDFDPLTGSKIALDTSKYAPVYNLTYKIAKNSKAIASLSKTNVNLIYDQRKAVLLLNANGKSSGLGKTSGGAICNLERRPMLISSDILIYNGTEVLSLGGHPASNM